MAGFWSFERIYFKLSIALISPEGFLLWDNHFKSFYQLWSGAEVPIRVPSIGKIKLQKHYLKVFNFAQTISSNPLKAFNCVQTISSNTLKHLTVCKQSAAILESI